MYLINYIFIQDRTFLKIDFYHLTKSGNNSNETYSTVTDFARLRGLSTSARRCSAA